MPPANVMPLALMIIFGLATLGELVLVVLPSPGLAALMGVIFALGFCLALPRSDLITGTTAVVLMLAGGWMLASAGLPAVEWLRALSSLGAVYAMTVAVRVVGIPLELGNYALLLRRGLERATAGFTGGQFMTWTGLNYVLSLLSLYGSLPITYNLMDQAVGGEKNAVLRKRLFSTTMIRSIALAATWGPVSAGVTLTLHLAGLPWQAIVPAGILLSVVGFTISYLLERPFLPAWDELAAGREQQETTVDGNTAGPLSMFIFFGLLVATVIYCQQRLGWSIFPSVSVASIITSVLWVLRLHRIRSYPRFLYTNVIRPLPQTAGSLALFTALGMFTYALENSPTGIHLVNTVADAALRGTSPFGTFVLAQGLMLFMSFLGVPGLVSIGVVGKPLVLSGVLEPLPLSMALIIGNVMTGSSSPFSVSNLVLASLHPYTNAAEIGLRFNLLWAVLFGVAATLVIGVAYF